MISEDKLIQDNMGLVVAIAKMYRPANQNEMDDYIQEGCIALLKTIRKFDPSRGKLSTIAWKQIGWAILKYINKQKKYTHISNNDMPSLCYKEEGLWEILPKTLTKKELVVISLKQEGYTFTEIGEQLGGYTRSWANKIYRTGIDKIKKADK